VLRRPSSCWTARAPRISIAPNDVAKWQLQISPKTVEVFRQNLLRKGGAKNSVRLVLTARARGWLATGEGGLVPEA
jgi:hypothetical protein